jgi:hypothetical protein
VCTSLDKNTVTHSVVIGSKSVRNGGALIFKSSETLLFDKLTTELTVQGRDSLRGAQICFFMGCIKGSV